MATEAHLQHQAQVRAMRAWIEAWHSTTGDAPAPVGGAAPSTGVESTGHPQDLLRSSSTGRPLFEEPKDRKPETFFDKHQAWRTPLKLGKLLDALGINTLFPYDKLAAKRLAQIRFDFDSIPIPESVVQPETGPSIESDEQTAAAVPSIRDRMVRIGEWKKFVLTTGRHMLRAQLEGASTGTAELSESRTAMQGTLARTSQANVMYAMDILK